MQVVFVRPWRLGWGDGTFQGELQSKQGCRKWSVAILGGLRSLQVLHPETRLSFVGAEVLITA